MARAGYRIFDADTHIIEPVEPIEAYLSAAGRGGLAALGPLCGGRPARAGCPGIGSAGAPCSTAAWGRGIE